MEEEEDDLYGAPSTSNGQDELPIFDSATNGNDVQMKQEEDDDEEGEEEDDSESVCNSHTTCYRSH